LNIFEDQKSHSLRMQAAERQIKMRVTQRAVTCYRRL